MNISETSGPIAIIFYLKHHLGRGGGRGKAALGLGPDRITNGKDTCRFGFHGKDTCSSQRVIMGKLL